MCFSSIPYRYNDYLNSTIALQKKHPKWFVKWQKDFYKSMLLVGYFQKICLTDLKKQYFWTIAMTQMCEGISRKLILMLLKPPLTKE